MEVSGNGVSRARGLVFGALDKDVLLALPKGSTNRSAIDVVASRSLIALWPAPVPTPKPVPLDPGIARGGERANGILAGRGPSPDPIPERPSQSCERALAMVGVNAFAPYQAWSR